MKSPARLVTPRLIEAATGGRVRDTTRWIAERRRRLMNEPHRVHYFHQVDDPYSTLAAQVLGALARRYDVCIEPHLVGPPPDEAAPERERLAAFARRDAADIALGYGLTFPASPAPRSEADCELASCLLAAAIYAGRFDTFAPRVGDALWKGGRSELDKLALELAPVASEAARAAVSEGSALRGRLGHYLGATFYYGGEWYWGVDRLQHLERRLRSLGALRGADTPALIAPRPEPPPGRLELDPAERLKLEFYLSLRSPYSYIAMARVYALQSRLPVDLVLRPVLPMVMRGLPVPRAKQLYIMRDTKREADDVGVPFGRLCDPVGRPVERAFSLYPWARERGRAEAFLLSFARAAFAEGIDTGEDAGLRRVVERVGLSWTEAARHLDRGGWRQELEENRRTLLDLGLWGVPSFRLVGRPGEPDYSTWGQDRIWRVEEEIRSRAAKQR